MHTGEPDMPKKNTKLEKLSEMIYVTVEEIRNLGTDGLDSSGGEQ